MNLEVHRYAGRWPLAVAHLPGVQSVCVGLWFARGSRYETEETSGISHFVEHLMFKGTEKRSAQQISEDVEGVGGYLNAYTGRDKTCYYGATTRRHFPRLLDVLLDMLTHSTFPSDEVERERAVILEEIKMIEDQTSQIVLDHLARLMWPEHPLGRPIIGYESTIKQFSRKTLLDYRAQFFSLNDLTITVAGATSMEEVCQLLSEKKLDQYSTEPVSETTPFIPYTAKKVESNWQFWSKSTEQSQIALGFMAMGRHDPQRYASRLASVMLGENMSSRLFQVLREQHGLVYSIDSYYEPYPDTGNLGIVAGMSPENIPQALSLILNEIKKMVDRPPSEEELQRAKEYLVGSMWMSLESSSNQMNWLGECLLDQGRVITPLEREQVWFGVTADQVQSALAEIYQNKGRCLAVVGPAFPVKKVETLLSTEGFF